MSKETSTSKEVVKRGLLGFPLGIAIGYVITIVTSLWLGWGGGAYFPASELLINEFGSEIAAVAFQAVLCGILGATFAAASVIWEIEDWSIAKQTGTYFAISSLAMFPIAYFTHWMERTVAGFLVYFLAFVVIFFVMWVAQYLIFRNTIKRINEQV